MCVTWGAFRIVLVFELPGSRIKSPSSKRTPLYLSSMCVYHSLTRGNIAWDTFPLPVETSKPEVSLSAMKPTILYTKFYP